VLYGSRSFLVIEGHTLRRRLTACEAKGAHGNVAAGRYFSGQIQLGAVARRKEDAPAKAFGQSLQRRDELLRAEGEALTKLNGRLVV
jgi:hypothetical protein